VDDRVAILGSRLTRGFVLEGTGIDHLRDALAWTPDNPVLVDALLELVTPAGQVVDRVHSYTALRTVGTRAGRFLLNGRPYEMRLVLDQGYWPQSGLTPPDDQALRHDLELVKAMGFNGVRKHQKIEDPRFLHWADRLGVLVWYEMPPAYRFDTEAVRRVTTEWAAAIERDRSHPCIVVWVPFNESTGVLSLGTRPAQREWVQALTRLTKALDPTRPVISNDGWETVGGDLVGVHDYDQDPASLAARWNGDVDALLRTFAHHGRLQTLDHDGSVVVDDDRPIVLSEFGGIGWDPGAPVEREQTSADLPEDRLAQPAAWGYSTVGSVEELGARYRELLDAVHAIDRLAGFCYTQLADTYQEVNGLLHADRTPKLPLELIAACDPWRRQALLRPLQLGTVGRRPDGSAGEDEGHRGRPVGRGGRPHRRRRAAPPPARHHRHVGDPPATRRRRRHRLARRRGPRRPHRRRRARPRGQHGHGLRAAPRRRRPTPGARPHRGADRRAVRRRRLRGRRAG
jgi:hypothetical protein